MDENGLLGRSILYGHQYGFLEALLISAGAAGNSAKDQAIARAASGAEFVNGLFGSPLDIQWVTEARNQALREMAEQAQLYDPLRQQFPFASALGESLPAAILGLRGMASHMQFNLGRTALDQAAKDYPVVRRFTRAVHSF